MAIIDSTRRKSPMLIKTLKILQNSLCCLWLMSLLFNMLSSLAIAFLPSSKHLLISWLKSPSSVTLEPSKIKSLTVSIVSPSISHEVMGWSLFFECWVLRQLFHSPLSLSSRDSLVPLCFSYTYLPYNYYLILHCSIFYLYL